MYGEVGRERINNIDSYGNFENSSHSDIVHGNWRRLQACPKSLVHEQFQHDMGGLITVGYV